MPFESDSPASPPAPVRRATGVTAVERGLAILDSFLARSGCQGLSELARATGLPKPTVLRSLVSLERMGYAVRLSTGRYQLGPRVVQLGDAYRAQFRLEDHVLPVLRELALATGEMTAFHIRERGQRLMLFRVESQHSVREVQSFPTLVPLDDTSASHVLREADGDRDLPLAQLRVFHTEGRFNPQTASIATAVHGAQGRLVGAMTVSAPINRMAASELPAMAQRLAEAAQRLSLVLGARLPLAARPVELLHL